MQKYHTLFEQADSDRNEAKANAFFSEVNLPNTTLSQIWKLAERDGDGKLNRGKCRISFDLLLLPTIPSLKYTTVLSLNTGSLASIQLDGDYVFRFDIVGYNGAHSDLTFHFSSQDFCGQVTNTSILGRIRTFSDNTYTVPSTIFAENQLIWVWIQVESAFIVTSVDVADASVNNQTYPAYGLDNFVQTYFGVQFSMIALIPPFHFDSNTIQFDV